MKKILMSIIFFIICFLFSGVVYAEVPNTPVISGVEYPDSTSLKIKYDPKNTNGSYKVLVYNMTGGKIIHQDINTNSYTFTGLETGKVYNFKVRIYYLEGVIPRLSDWSNIVSAAPRAGNVIISSLTGSNGQGVLNYTTTGKPQGVEIFVKELGKVYRTTSLTNYTIAGLTNGSTYTVTARTYYVNGATGDWSAPVYLQLGSTSSIVLGNITTSKGKAVVKYTTSGKPQGVEISVAELGKSFRTANLKTYTITGLTTGKKYTVVARTYFSNGTYGAWSTAKSFTSQLNNAEKMVSAIDKIAWPIGTSAKKWKAKYSGSNSKPGAKQYFDKRGYKSRAKRADCGYFVNTVVYTAIGKKVKALPASAKKKYNNLSGFMCVSKGKKVSATNLKPGDIIRYRKTNGHSQHTFLYYGKVNGKHYIAEAGRGSSASLIRFPIIREAHAGGKTYKWANNKIKISTLQVWRVKE